MFGLDDAFSRRYLVVVRLEPLSQGVLLTQEVRLHPIPLCRSGPAGARDESVGEDKRSSRKERSLDCLGGRQVS